MKIMTDDEFMALPKNEAEKHIQKRSDPQAAAMEVMIDSFSMQNDPHVGCFWYDTNTIHYSEWTPLWPEMSPTIFLKNTIKTLRPAICFIKKYGKISF